MWEVATVPPRARRGRDPGLFLDYVGREIRPVPFGTAGRAFFHGRESRWTPVIQWMLADLCYVWDRWRRGLIKSKFIFRCVSSVSYQRTSETAKRKDSGRE